MDISLEWDLMKRHSLALRDVRNKVIEAGEAGKSVDLNGGAFGILCSWMPPLFDLVLGDGVPLIYSVADGVDDAANGMWDAAVIFEEADADRANDFDKKDNT